MKILFVSAEVTPFAKTGGLADVAGALPKYLHASGHDVRVVMPAYQKIEHDYHIENSYDLRVLEGALIVPTGSGPVSSGVFEGKLPDSEVPIYFIGEWNHFGRARAEIYGYDDDPLRFAFFSKAALELTRFLGWRPDVVHAHDWHAAPAVTWLATAGQSDDWFANIPSVFTVHNLAYQGRTNWDIFNYLQLFTHSLLEEAYGEVNFMARGLYHATMINTVSPRYAEEILTPEFGEGLETLLKARKFDVHGILNGVDYTVWNPETDTKIPQNYSFETIQKKNVNKAALQKAAGLPQRNDVPLVAMVSRLDNQKGLDLTGHVIHKLMNNHGGEAQFVVLGTGKPEYEAMFQKLANYHADKMRAFLKYDGMLAQLIYAGADMFLMPSRFEPCGLSQLISLRYGTVPVVRATGGLASTVIEDKSGFVFHEYDANAFWNALHRSLHAYYSQPFKWREIQHFGMNANYSWENSAKKYEQLYTWAISRTRWVVRVRDNGVRVD